MVGPSWHGDPSKDVTLLARILVDGSEDLDAVHRLEDIFVMTIIEGDTSLIVTDPITVTEAAKAAMDIYY